MLACTHPSMDCPLRAQPWMTAPSYRHKWINPNLAVCIQGPRAFKRPRTAHANGLRLGSRANSSQRQLLRPLVVRSSAAVQADLQSDDDSLRALFSLRAKPTILSRPPALPPPPKSGNLLDVIPYLVKLAVSDRQLWWRLAISISLMLASKASGAKPSP
jgi:hypothetical protein